MGDLRRGVSRLASNYGRLGLTLAFGLLEVPLLIYWIGVEAFGVVSLLGPTMGLAQVGGKVIDQTFIHELGSVYHAQPRARFLRTYQSAWFVSGVGAASKKIIAALLVFALLPNLQIGPELLGSAQVMGAMLACFTVGRMILSPAMAMYLVRERFITRNLLIVATRSSGLVAATVGVLVIERGRSAEGLLFYGILAPSLMLFWAVLPAVWVMLKERDLVPRPRRGDIRAIAKTFSWNTLATVSISLTGRVPLIFVNALFGNTGSAIYGLAWRLSSYARMIIVGATYGLEAVSTRISATDSTGDAVRRFVVHATRLNATIALPAAVGILILTEPVLVLWVGMRVPEAASLAKDAVLISQIVVVGLTLRGIGDGWIQILYGSGKVARYAPYLAALALATPVAAYLAYGLRHVDKPVHLIDGLAGMFVEQSTQMGNRDVLLAISFRPYAKETADIVGRAREAGATVIVISDSRVSPVAREADVAFDVRENAAMLFFAKTRPNGDIDSYILLMRGMNDEFEETLCLEIDERQISGDRVIEQAELDEALPHLDLDLFHDVVAQHVGLGAERLEIAADGHRLGDHPPVRELERRHLGRADPGQVLVGLVLARHQVELGAGDLQPLLGEEDVDPTRVRRARLGVEADGLGQAHRAGSSGCVGREPRPARAPRQARLPSPLAKPACPARCRLL